MGDGVKDEVTNDQGGGHLRWGGAGARAAQHRMHPGHQFPDAKRFGDVVIRPQGQTADLVVLAATRGEHEDVAVREGADPSAHLQAVEFGQPQIQHHNIGGKATGLVHGLGAGVRLAGVEAGPDEVGGHHLSQGLFIIDDQHPPRGRGGGRCAVSHRPQYRFGRGEYHPRSVPGGEIFIKSSNITLRPPSPLCPTPGRRHRLPWSVQQAPPGISLPAPHTRGG